MKKSTDGDIERWKFVENEAMLLWLVVLILSLF